MAKKKVLMIVGGRYHPYEQGAQIVKGLVEASGRYSLECTEDHNALRAGSISQYDALVVYAEGRTLTKDQLSGMLGFVRSGGAFVGLHSAAASWEGHPEYVEMLGCTFASHGPLMEFPVNIRNADHMITQRLIDFRITDELYLLDQFDPEGAEVLLSAQWKHVTQPIAYTKAYGEGSVFFLALGHDGRALGHPSFQKLVLRGLDWALGRRPKKPLKGGVIGYGAQFGMGKMHLRGFQEGAGFESVAMCDIDPPRRVAAAEDYPGIETYSSLGRMLRHSDVEIITVVTPHNSHARLALQCLEAGRHVICEKPFCVTVKEADAMIAAAQKKNLMLSVFHNRRWDGDYVAVRDILAKGLLGEVFHIEACMGGFGHPGYWWRSHKPIAGGAFYDWGAHVTDWVLGLVPSKLKEISGFLQTDRRWHDVTNEEHCHASLRFENGCFADIELGNLGAIKKPKYRILGTQGGLEMWSEDKVKVVTFKDGVRFEGEIPCPKDDWMAYYRNIGDHLLLGEPLEVTPESARRVIAVLEMAEKSSKAGKALPFPKHCQ